tara:strand:+ start:2757 stop:3506 length:750 start_codon:yes stop_codon:yes gene_type:complete
MPNNNTSKTLEELFNTKFAIKPQLKSPLQNCQKLDPSYLANVTDEDIDSYEEEYQTFLKDTLRPLAMEQDKVMEFVSHAINNIFGSNSKESKYFQRAKKSNGNSVLHTNFAKLSDIYSVKEAVKEAREYAKNNSSVALEDKDISQIDLAIKYLIEKGFKYGEDFTSSNAVNIAKTEMLHNITDDASKDSSIVEYSDDCSDVCKEQEFEISLYENVIHRECPCGAYDKTTKISIDTDDSGKVFLNCNEIN